MHLVVQPDRGLDGRLGVELGREGYLEQHVLDDVARIRLGNPQRTAAQQRVVEAPRRGAQRRGIAHLTLQRPTGPAARRGSVASPAAHDFREPAFGRVAIGPQAAAVDPGVRDRVEHLLARSAQQGRGHGRAGHADQQHVIEPHAVEGVLQGDDSLDLVGLDHGRQHVADAKRRRAGCRPGAGSPSRPQARIAPRLSEGWPHSAANQVSL